MDRDKVLLGDVMTSNGARVDNPMSSASADQPRVYPVDESKTGPSEMPQQPSLKERFFSLFGVTKKE